MSPGPGGHGGAFRLDRLDALLLAVLIGSYIAVWFLPFSASRFGDGNFHGEAKAISMAIRGAGSWSAIVITRAPGPTLYYAIPYLLVPSGSSDDAYWFAAFLWTFLWMAVSVLLLRRAGRWIAGSSAGAWAAFLIVLSPFGVYYSYGISAEPPAYVSAVILTFGWARWRTFDRSRPTVQSAAAWCSWFGFGLLLLNRPNAVLLLGVALGAGVVLRRVRAGSSRREAAFAMGAAGVAGTLFALSFCLVTLLPGGWQQGNLSHVVLQGRFQFRAEPWDWRFWGKAQRKGSQDHFEWTRREKWLRDIARETGRPIPQVEWQWIREDIKAHPILTLRMTAIRLPALQIVFVGSRSPEDFRLGPLGGKFVFWLFHIAANAIHLGVLAGAAVFFWKRRGDLVFFWPLWGPWLALLVFHAITYAEPRYLFPGRPGLTLMAAAVFDRFWRGLHLRRQPVDGKWD